MEGVHHGHHGQEGRHGQDGPLGAGGGLLGSQLKLGDRLVIMVKIQINSVYWLANIYLSKFQCC